MTGTVLSQDEINALLGGTRTRGVGGQVLTDFISRGVAGEKVDLESGPLAGKTPESAFSALGNAQRKVNLETNQRSIPGSENVKVIKNKEGVFLINTGLSAAE